MDHTPNRSCLGCEVKGELFHYWENCPNRNKICYNCGRQGHIREVCRAVNQPQTEKDDWQRTDFRPSNTGMIAWDKTCPPPASEFKGMSQYFYLPIRSLNKQGIPAEQHRQWINNEPYKRTEVEEEKKRWIQHYMDITPGYARHVAQCKQWILTIPEVHIPWQLTYKSKYLINKISCHPTSATGTLYKQHHNTKKYKHLTLMQFYDSRPPVLWSKWPLASSLLHAIKTCCQACPPGYLMHFS